MKVANFQAGALRTQSQALDLRLLDNINREMCIQEAGESQEISYQDAKSAEDYLECKFGNSITHSLIKPTLIKFFGTELRNLIPEAPRLFGIERVIVADKDESIRLKKHPNNDRKFSFTSSDQGISPLNNFYPREGGIGLWVRD